MTMTPGKAIRDVLVNDTAVAAVVGVRVYLGAVPDRAERPYLLVSLADTARHKRQSGTLADHRVCAMDIIAAADTYRGAAELADAADAALLDRAGGDIVDITATGGPRDLPDVDAAGIVHAVSMTYDVIFGA